MVRILSLAWLQLEIRRGSGSILHGYVGCRKTRQEGFWRNHSPGRGGERRKDQDWP